MVDIECLACDKTLVIPKSFDIDNCDCQLVCSECKALLHVRLVKGKLWKYKIVERRRSGGPVNILVSDELTKDTTRRITSGEGRFAKPARED